MILSTINIFAQVDSLQQKFVDANESYKNEQYNDAITDYLKIVNSGNESAEVYYNLGNSYFKINNVPKAILYYEKAKKLDPNNDDITFNIKYANQFIKDDYSQVPDFFADKIYLNIVHSASSNTWAIVSIILFILSLLSFLWFLFSKIRIRRKLAFLFSIVFIFVSISTMIFSAQMKNHFTNANSAIVEQINTLKSSPQDDGTDLVIINPGVKVKIEGENADWYEVQLPNGVKGWIKKETVELI